MCSISFLIKTPLGRGGVGILICKTTSRFCFDRTKTTSPGPNAENVSTGLNTRHSRFGICSGRSHSSGIGTFSLKLWIKHLDKTMKSIFFPKLEAIQKNIILYFSISMDAGLRLLPVCILHSFSCKISDWAMLSLTHGLFSPPTFCSSNRQMFGNWKSLHAFSI